MKPRQRKKLIKKILNKIILEPAPMNYDKGEVVLTPNTLTKKRKRRKCHITPKIVKPTMKYKEIVEEALEPQEEYEPWRSYSDGQKDWGFIESEKGERKKKPWKKRRKK